MLNVRDKYRLELRWKEIDYSKEGKVKLIEAYFSGPALKIAEKIQPNNRITMDLSKMYRVFIPNYYLSKLSWSSVTYSNNGEVLLGDAALDGAYINSIPKLNNTDFFVIDTAKHEDYSHPFHLNYDAWLCNENKEMYSF